MRNSTYRVYRISYFMKRCVFFPILVACVSIVFLSKFILQCNATIYRQWWGPQSSYKQHRCRPENSNTDWSVLLFDFAAAAVGWCAVLLLLRVFRWCMVSRVMLFNPKIVMSDLICLSLLKNCRQATTKKWGEKKEKAQNRETS